MSIKDRIDYQKKKARIVATISEEANRCGLTDARVLVDDGRPEITGGIHKAKICSPVRGTLEFDVAPAWFDKLDSRSEDNLRFAVRLAVMELSK